MVNFWKSLNLLWTNKNYNYYLWVSEIIRVVVNQDIIYLFIYLVIDYLSSVLFIYLLLK